jgi:hypothetical protein
MKILKWSGIALGAILGLVCLALIGLYFASQSKMQTNYAIAAEPVRATRRLNELLGSELVKRDPGLPSAMILGLARAAEAEPDSAEAMLVTLVERAGMDAIEALVELREERELSKKRWLHEVGRFYRHNSRARKTVQAMRSVSCSGL